ncbi:MAG: hypothetical protein M1294_00565 [Firmicutes bacterium]|jgi:hypothetical protein|uniref:Uncharacterized protein n=1 Tax=Sulfobacillus benefaciens TaxID=453960 RepID=A0A2T2WWI7_9FIRM|nr:hypothetical protein [Bacillota bacterium]MCL5012790.1 hypothetical protein [Bacillota bacterium]PSR26601.1 MAG: hypothetical protein C7B43_13335 [Sulfobacillus benefaciens]
MIHRKMEPMTVQRKTNRRINPYGLLRLLIVAVIFAFLALGHGTIWWAGFALLTLVLIAVGGGNVRPTGPWLGSIGLIFFAFIHVGIISLEYGAIPMALSFMGYFVQVLRRLAG